MNLTPKFNATVLAIFILSVVFCYKSFAQVGSPLVSQDMALRVVAEGYSLHREDHVQRHIATLSSTDPLARTRAAWYLSSLQGSNAVSAMIAHALTEKNEEVLVELVFGIQTAFFSELAGNMATLKGSDALHKYALEVDRRYRQSGYDAMIRNAWTSVSRLGDPNVLLFLEASSERFEPEVFRILADLAFDSLNERIRARAREILIVGAGFHPNDFTSKSEVREKLEDSKFLGATMILERMRTMTFLRPATNSITSATILFRQSDSVRRGLAYRMFLSSIESLNPLGGPETDQKVRSK